jgi:hypothetical protein
MAKRKARTVEFTVHTPNLLNEILTNHGTGILEKPLQIFGGILHEVAQRAIALDDPEMNILMMRLTLYRQADPELCSGKEIAVALEMQRARMK